MQYPQVHTGGVCPSLWEEHCSSVGLLWRYFPCSKPIKDFDDDN
jgi:hypothetical protein